MEKQHKQHIEGQDEDQARTVDRKDRSEERWPCSWCRTCRLTGHWRIARNSPRTTGSSGERFAANCVEQSVLRLMCSLSCKTVPFPAQDIKRRGQRQYEGNEPRTKYWMLSQKQSVTLYAPIFLVCDRRRCSDEMRASARTVPGQTVLHAAEHVNRSLEKQEHVGAAPPVQDSAIGLGLNVPPAQRLGTKPAPRTTHRLQQW